MGVLFKKDGKWVVLEAVQPVKYTPADRWMHRSEGGHVEAKRLRASIYSMGPSDAAKVRLEGERFLGRGYDLAFGWDDRRIYCSELVWKAYDRALGLKLGKVQRLGDFDLSSPMVREKIQERYHGHPPLDEPVISPEAMYEAPELEPAWSK